MNTHPLSKDGRWTFAKPALGFHSSFVLLTGEGEEQKKSISNAGYCREAIISNIRTGFKGGGFTNFQGGGKPWEGKLKPTGKILLAHPLCSGHGETKLQIAFPTLTPFDHLQFSRVADALVGIPCTLLNPDRQPGDWWVTKKEEAKDGDFAYWYGSDNFFLRHPALMAIVLGLFRQARLLCTCGFGGEVLKGVEHAEIVEAVSTVNRKAALGLADRLRAWISVPVAAGSETAGNFPFPWYPRKAKQVSHWQRFVRLQRAAHRHGYDEVLGEDFHDGWGLLDKSPQHHTGVFSFWGGHGDQKVTPAHKRIMSLGKPLTRKTDGVE
ncbi:MAG: hypothetical protein L0Y56_14775 [Nitrospira sp.]|nr:hypothetical protein [Nitrospira sp.]